MKLTSETKLLAMMGVIVALGGGFLALSNRMANAPEAPATPRPTPAPPNKETFDTLLAGTRHLKGNPDARFTVIEFADFQCPTCRRAYNRALKNFGKSLDIRFGFRHFPLENIHNFALPAAAAAEYADKKGKFWEAYDALFEGPDVDLDQATIESALAKIGLKVKLTDMVKEDSSLMDLAHKDRDAGTQLGVDQTPTFLVYDKTSKRVSIAVGLAPLLVTLREVPGMPTPEPTPVPAK